MDKNPIISISDFKNKKVVSFRFLDLKDSKLSLIFERVENDVFKIYVDSKNPYCVFELYDTGYPLFKFSNKEELYFLQK